ncbi:phage tail spike protein [Caldanaerobacter subterraneus]|uniref:Prophage tail endopeptidase domain-containing protein n=1 Tax=Caldanaerobacter subterraneus TaxID=911092 RepID=A0A7Y2PKX7_9THEO|nr:phage tail spike protein [Caldanaerobacter subterraneus]NNG66145.1 hypothetical protein [Caldanaerobacter subterraneus]
MYDINSYSIDYNKKPQKPQLFLAKPNRTIIAKLKEAYNINHKLKLGNINELSFDLPIVVDVHGKLVDNSHIDMLKKRYLIKVVLGNFSEWYIIDEITKSSNDEGDNISVHCFSLGYELKDKNIIEYKKDNVNATQALVDAISNTIWTTGYIDADFDLKYRSFDITNTSVLDFVFQVAETFGALVIWDTENRTINLYNPDNIGTDKGLTISYKKYLKAINQEDKDDSVVTRLKVFGKDGLSIQRVNPTGTNYIEDFSYFMYPFQRDANKNVLQHSDYMSDSLCNALLDYQDLVESKTGEFNNYLLQLENLQGTLAIKQSELQALQDQLNTVLDAIDQAQTTGQDASNLIAQKNTLLSQIAAKQSEINKVNTDIASVQSQINNIRNILKLENNFTADQIKELNQFVIEKVWIDSNYTDDRQLYQDAIKIFEKMKFPVPVINVDIVNFLEVIEEQKNWDKLVLGDIVTIKYERFGINVKAKIVEIDFDYENSNINITIANTKEIESDEEKFLKMLYKSISTSTQVDMNKYKWNNTVATVDDVTQILNNVWDTAKRAIESGVNNSVTIDRRGITIKDPADPNRFIRMTNGVIGFTNDGGNTFKTVLDASGVYAERLIGKILLGNQLTITDDTGKFTITGSLLTVKDDNNLTRVQLGKYDAQKYGLKIVNKTGTAVILDQDGILQTWQEGRTDNVDSNNPLYLYVYIPDKTISIQQAILRFKLQAFRAYEQGAASYTIGTQTSSTKDVEIQTSSYGVWILDPSDLPLPGDWMVDSGAHSHTIYSSGTHNHGVPNGTVLLTSGGGSVTWVESGSHTHGCSTDGLHVHAMNVTHYHKVTIPAHSHTVDIPPHSHGIIYGIYTSSKPSSVAVVVNGSTVGTYTSDQNNVDVRNYLIKGQWNEIKFLASGLGRIDATIFLQVFLGV